MFNRNKKEKEKKPFYKRWWFITLVVIFIFGALGNGDDETDVAEESDTEIVEEVEADTADEEVVEETIEETEPEEAEVVEEPIVNFDPNDYDAEITYEDLARNPDDYFFSAVTFEGKIIQVMQGDDMWQYRVAINDDYDSVMFIEIESELLETRILEDDYIRFYGTYMGEITYQSTLGGNITIPGLMVDHFEFK